jgi:hypothetical protein
MTAKRSPKPAGKNMSEIKWENLDTFRMDQVAIDEVVREAPGCTVCWTRADGQPLGVWVSHAVLDGIIHLTTTLNRPKTTAWMRDARMSAVFAVPGKGAVTAIGRVELSDDPGLRRRFLEALCDKMHLKGDPRRQWIAHMDSDGRLTGRVSVDRYITFDERKLSF